MQRGVLLLRQQQRSALLQLRAWPCGSSGMSRGGGFDRERFLLRTVAGVFIAQFALYAIALAACIQLSFRQLPRPTCTNFAERLQDTFETALGTSLALLSGGSIVAARRRDPNS